MQIVEFIGNKIARFKFLLRDIPAILRSFDSLQLSHITDICLSYIQNAKTPAALLSRFDDATTLIERIASRAVTQNQRSCACEALGIINRQREILIPSFARFWAQTGKTGYLKELLKSHSGLSLSVRSFIKHELAAWQIYTYCSVRFPTSEKTYYYIADIEAIAKGDSVLVPTGADDCLTQATVVKVEYFTYDSVPFPLRRTKHIHSKI